MFKIKSVAKKNEDWLVLSLVNSAGDLIENVSVNRVSKKGDLFPNFDDIKADTKIDGRLWESDSGKQYLFAPKGGAKAPVKQPTNASEEAEYPIHEKLETVLNKQVGHTILLQQILELLQPKKKVVDEFPEYDSETGPDF